MKAFARNPIVAIIVSMLVISVFTPLFITIAGKPPSVWVVTQAKYPIESVRNILDDLGSVQGLVLVFEIEDNNTKAINKVVDTMAFWLSKFPDYRIDVQISYLFAEKYGYLLPEEKGANWVLNSTACFSDSFMREYYSALANLFRGFRNVELFTGFNEPYNHFANKYLAQEVIKKEYTVFKSVCSWVKFSTEFSMPVDFWEDFLGFPENVTVENDMVPFWRDYSDFVGINLWVDRKSPLGGYEEASEARFENALALVSNWSQKLGKPIHINEFPCWYEGRVRTFAKEFMINSNICAFYQLCFNSTGAVNDGWEYAIYNFEMSKDYSFRRNPICFNIYHSVFADLARSRFLFVSGVLVFCVITFIGAGIVLKRKRWNRRMPS